MKERWGKKTKKMMERKAVKEKTKKPWKQQKKVDKQIKEKK